MTKGSGDVVTMGVWWLLGSGDEGSGDVGEW